MIKKEVLEMMWEDFCTLDKLEGAYIGDLCYALEPDIYHGVWGAHGYEHDHYTTEDGLQFAMGSTAFGDGFYHGSDGSGFSVDAGIIGVADLRLATKIPREELKDFGVIYPTATKVDFKMAWGYFEVTVFEGDTEIASFSIDTDI